ncbi:hypothetical protein M8C21_021661, partial [Ambrosia artemisiifolia]
SSNKIVRSSSESDLASFLPSKRRNSLSGGASSLLSSVSVEEDVEAEEIECKGSLVLANYAKYLKEMYVQGDVLKAEEYCSRAILANPNDGTALSMYAELIWETHKDASRARSYFDQAVKASPDDCYVMASYARFLWDADEDEEEDEQEGSNMNLAAQCNYQNASQQFPIVPMAAASQG